MKRWLFGFLLLVLAAAIAWIVARPDKYHSAERRAWAERALGELRAETPGSDMGDSAWIQSGCLYFRNGEWIQFRSICHKEDPNVHDLFVGRGSDGNWYYSTFHFCRDVCVLQMSAQPENLAAFIRDYALAKFDGLSDACLRPTWPEMKQLQ